MDIACVYVSEPREPVATSQELEGAVAMMFIHGNRQKTRGLHVLQGLGRSCLFAGTGGAATFAPESV